MKDSVCPIIYPLLKGKIKGFIPFPRVLVLFEMQSATSRIWNPITVSISTINLADTSISLLVLLYGCTPYVIKKCIEKKIDGNHTSIWQVISNKLWKRHLKKKKKQLQFDYLPPISQTVQVRRTRSTEHSWVRKDKLISEDLLWNSFNWTH